MASNPHLADFLEKMKGSGAGTKAGVLPPIVAPGLFSSITGASEQGNYNSLSRIGQRIQQARADADQAHIMKAQRAREKRLMDMIKNLQTQVSTPAPSFGGGGGGSIPSIGRGGSGLSPGSGISLPVIGGGGGGGSILPPIVAGSPPRPRGVRFPQIF